MKTEQFRSLFGASTSCALVGMIHVRALPGTPRHDATGGIDAIVAKAVEEAKIYLDCGLEALMVENMHDIPYVQGPGPEAAAVMAVVTRAVREAIGPERPLGVQILAGATTDALAAALAGGANFIRAEGFVFGHVADEGWTDACAGQLLRYRRAMDATHIAILTDIKKKHSAHAVTADVDIVQTLHAAEYFLSDGVIVTGAATGESASLDDLCAVAAAATIPVWVGSGITERNVRDYAALADGLIVGSYFKEDGHWDRPLAPARIKGLLRAFCGAGQ